MSHPPLRPGMIDAPHKRAALGDLRLENGETIQDAVSEALDRARETLEGITRFEVKDISGVLEGPRTLYQVEIRVWFTVLERMHG